MIENEFGVEPNSFLLRIENMGFDNKNTFSYNRDYLTQVSHNGLTYGFEYNGLGDITEVSVAGQAILRSACVRGETGDETTTVELDEEGEAQNSTVVNKDRYGRITKITRNNVKK